MNLADIEPASNPEALRRQFLSLRTLAVSMEQRSQHYSRLVDRSTKTASEVMAERDTNELLTNALLDAENALSEATRQRDLLMQAIADAAHKAGIICAGAALDGPTLLMVLDDMARTLQEDLPIAHGGKP